MVYLVHLVYLVYLAYMLHLMHLMHLMHLIHLMHLMHLMHLGTTCCPGPLACTRLARYDDGMIKQVALLSVGRAACSRWLVLHLRQSMTPIVSWSTS